MSASDFKWGYMKNLINDDQNVSQLTKKSHNLLFKPFIC